MSRLLGRGLGGRVLSDATSPLPDRSPKGEGTKECQAQKRKRPRIGGRRFMIAGSAYGTRTRDLCLERAAC